MLQELCNDASDTALIDNNSRLKIGYNPILEQLHCFQWEQYH